MNFEHRCTIPVAREELWNFLMDVPQMAACVPGVESMTPCGNDQYAGQMRVKVGPISLTLQGVVTIQERDPPNWRAATHAEANDRRVGGGVHITAQMTLIERGPIETELFIRAEARLLGKLGEFGQPVIRKRADETMAKFARNVVTRFHSPTPALRVKNSKGETPIAQPPEPEKKSHILVSAFVGGLIGAAAGLSLAVLASIQPPTDGMPVIIWPTVGLAALGAIVATFIRFLWEKRK